MLWLLLCLPGNYDMIGQPEPQVQEEIIEDAPQEEPEAKEEQKGSKEETKEESEEESKEEPQEELQLPDVPVDDIVEEISKAVESSVVDEARIRDIVREEIKEALKPLIEELETIKKSIQVEKPVKTEVSRKNKITDAPGAYSTQKSNTPEETWTLYLYTMEGCGPCIRSYNELLPLNGTNYKLYIAKNPTPFRDGSLVTRYPSYELYREGKFVKRWVGYTPVNTILEAVSE